MKTLFCLLTCLLLLCGVAICTQETNAPAAAGGDYVILLHGLGRTERSMNKMGKALADQGYRVVNHAYPSTRKDMPALLTLLESTITTHCTNEQARVHFVTHSLGGIVVRAYFATHPRDRLGRVVMLSPPNKGSEIPDTLHDWKPYQWAMGPVGLQLGTGTDDLPHALGPVDFDVGVITGDRTLNPLYSAWVKGVDDGKVSVESAKVKGMRDFLVVHASHTFIMRRREVIDQTIHFLASGRFKRDEKTETP